MLSNDSRKPHPWQQRRRSNPAVPLLAPTWLTPKSTPPSGTSPRPNLCPRLALPSCSWFFPLLGLGLGLALPCSALPFARPDLAWPRSANGEEFIPNRFVKSCSWAGSYKSLAHYCTRGWCRLEMLLGQTEPLPQDGFMFNFLVPKKKKVNVTVKRRELY